MRYPRKIIENDASKKWWEISFRRTEDTGQIPDPDHIKADFIELTSRDDYIFMNHQKKDDQDNKDGDRLVAIVPRSVVSCITPSLHPYGRDE